MKHARSDYDLIQDPRNKIPKDEPVFLLRGQDPKAQACLKLWADQAEKDGSDPELIELTRKHIALMSDWQRKIKSKKSDLPPKPVVGASFEVKKGQEWEATDFRSRGQRVRVEHIQGIDAICKITVGPNGVSVGMTQRQIRIPLRQFKPDVEMGYKLVTDVS